MANPHREAVAERARRRCEYCHFPERYSELRFVCDHIVARKHGGSNEIGNLAFCCPHCNSHKLDNIAGLDADDENPVRLFNRRRDNWSEHFRWEKAMLVGVTAIGRTTVKVLQINHPSRMRTRLALLTEGLEFEG